MYSFAPWWRPLVLLFSTAVLLGAALVAPPPAAAAEVVRWVSPAGTGSSCTQTKPCSLTTARDQVRSAAPGMTGDLVVRLIGGTYALTAPLALTSADSGRNGFRVRWEAAPGTTPVISGGRTVTGWKVHDSARGIWSATVPSTFVSRQLFVNGARATLASGTAASVLGTTTRTATGYTTSLSTLASWTRLTDTELVFEAGGPGSVAPWTWSACGVSSVSGKNVTVDAGCFGNGSRGFVDSTGTALPFITTPTHVQNNYALLDTAGEFYLDATADKVYYKPRAGESLSTASVVMPQATSLVSAVGTSALSITGLTFEHTTWIPDANLGVFTIQSNVIAAAPLFDPDNPAHVRTIPSGLEFRDTSDVVLERVTVRRMGTGGIAFTGNGVGNTVRGAEVSDVSANGITMGEGVGLSSAAAYQRDGTVSNSYVHHIGVEYLSGVGIFAGWVSGTRIEHNVVEDLPHIGISLGWGWGNPSEMVDNHIDHNRVFRTMQSTLGDGGPIYVLGGQGYETASTIMGNHVEGSERPYGAIYLDAGASHWMVTSNVVEHATSGWVFLQNIAIVGSASANLVAGNYSDTTGQTLASLGTQESNLVDYNELGLTSWPQAALDIVATSGLEAAYADLLS